MNTGWIPKRWLGVTLLVVLFSLLAAITLQVRPGQQGARFAPEPIIRGFPLGAAIRSSDSASAVEDEASVVAMREREIDHLSPSGTGLKRFEFVSPGEGALEYLFEREGADHAQDVVGFAPRPIIRSSDDTSAHEYEMTGSELGLDRAVETGLKRFEFVSPGEGALEYLFEREGADHAQDVGFAPRPIIRSSDDSSALEYEMTGNELGLDSAGGTGLKRFEFVSPGQGALEYLFEREGADHAQDVGFAPRPAIRLSDDTSTVEYEMTGNELGLDREGGAGWLRIRFAPVGEAYWDYVLALENNETSH